MSVRAPARSHASALLSPREVEVLEIASRGLTNGEIAGALGVSVHAVKFHLASVYRKLGVGNRTEAAVVYLQAGHLQGHERASEPE
jgi:DNA-binding CsgD family transcriptional regulator